MLYIGMRAWNPPRLRVGAQVRCRTYIEALRSAIPPLECVCNTRRNAFKKMSRGTRHRMSNARLRATAPPVGGNAARWRALGME